MKKLIVLLSAVFALFAMIGCQQVTPVTPAEPEKVERTITLYDVDAKVCDSINQAFDGFGGVYYLDKVSGMYLPAEEVIINDYTVVVDNYYVLPVYTETGTGELAVSQKSADLYVKYAKDGQVTFWYDVADGWDWKTAFDSSAAVVIGTVTDGTIYQYAGKFTVDIHYTQESYAETVILLATAGEVGEYLQTNKVEFSLSQYGGFPNPPDGWTKGTFINGALAKANPEYYLTGEYKYSYADLFEGDTKVGTIKLEDTESKALFTLTAEPNIPEAYNETLCIELAYFRVVNGHILKGDVWFVYNITCIISPYFVILESIQNSSISNLTDEQLYYCNPATGLWEALTQANLFENETNLFVGTITNESGTLTYNGNGNVTYTDAKGNVTYANDGSATLILKTGTLAADKKDFTKVTGLYTLICTNDLIVKPSVISAYAGGDAAIYKLDLGRFDSYYKEIPLVYNTYVFKYRTKMYDAVNKAVYWGPWTKMNKGEAVPVNRIYSSGTSTSAASVGTLTLLDNAGTDTRYAQFSFKAVGTAAENLGTGNIQVAAVVYTSEGKDPNLAHELALDCTNLGAKVK